MGKSMSWRFAGGRARLRRMSEAGMFVASTTNPMERVAQPKSDERWV